MHDPSHQLRQNGVAVTAQRIAVIKAVSCHQHSTADQIAASVRETIGTISKQAVYDSLALLTDKGLIRRIQPSGSPALFEGRVGDNHHHLICRRCAATVDVDCAIGEAPCLHAAEDHGFKIDEAEVIYWGVCPDCQAAE
ncbi:Fur family transcriptional regulator [Luteolibacter sp. AS25]|uniref:Fur family transcriptional regulator n=1 Tax=Luteolibacter sp. AS25 TaxID=3135776 RepID=UPI00398ACD85